MLTFAYDETTGFESINRAPDKATMIAGVVYEDNNEVRRANLSGNREKSYIERRRIAAYLNAVCNHCGATFPADLHRNHENGSRSNASRVGKVKAEIMRSLPEFLKAGTYDGKPVIFRNKQRKLQEEWDENCTQLEREGKYQLIVVYKGEDGRKREEEAIQLYDQNLASNLYLNMARDIIRKAIFINPYLLDCRLKEEEFNIPTRIIENNENKDEYKQFGYHFVNFRDNNNEYVSHWEIMSAGNARQILASASKIRNIKYHKILTDSIKYSNPSEARKYAFFYLSDAICSYLENRIAADSGTIIANLQQASFEEQTGVPGIDEKDAFAGIIIKRMKELHNNDEDLFFFYDDADYFLDQAEISYLKGNIFEALIIIYDGMNLTHGNARSYYSRRWFPLIRNKVLEKCAKDAFTATLNRALEYRVSDNLAQGRLLYIYETLEEAAEKNGIDKRNRYRLEDLGISAYTHVGDPFKAEECFNRCMQVEESAEESDIKLTRNRMITVYSDQFKFRAAEQMAVDVLQLETARVITRRESSYKAWSSLGQVYAFEGSDEAEACFFKVLDLLREERKADYYITLSYLLHLYIERGERDKYEKCAADYFNGITGLSEQLDYLLKEGSKQENARFSLKYALYVYIKAFYVFYKENPASQGVLRRLTNLEKTIKTALPGGKWTESLLLGHPWELIFKYAELLEGYDADGQYDGRNRKKRIASVDGTNEFIIDMLMKYGELELLRQQSALRPDSPDGREKHRNGVDELWSQLAEKGCVVDNGGMNTEQKEAVLAGMFTYMYH